jgi:hypothetical protein
MGLGKLVGEGWDKILGRAASFPGRRESKKNIVLSMNYDIVGTPKFEIDLTRRHLTAILSRTFLSISNVLRTFDMLKIINMK